jgi:hypothetical protein
MMLDPHAATLIALVGGAAWLMMQAGLSKNALEFRRKRHVCPSCGRDDGCSCGA